MASEIGTLERFLRGELHLATTIVRFEPAWRRESEHHLVATGRANPSLVVTPQHLTPMLEAFLEGQQSREQLSAWASLILALPAFVVPKHAEAGSAPGAVRAVLESLATSPAETSVTPSIVQGCLRALSQASAS